MNNEEMDDFIDQLSPIDAINIIGLTPDQISAVKGILSPLTKQQAEYFVDHFKRSKKQEGKILK